LTRRIDSPDTETDLQLKLHLLQDSPQPFIVRAGAGSGKTTSLIKALANLVDSRGDQLRANQQRIACITYTEVAVEEIRGDVGDSPVVHVSTIHSFLWELCRPFQADIGTWVRSAIQNDIDELEETKAGFASKPKTHEKTKLANAEAIAKKIRQLDNFNPLAMFTYGVATNYDRGVLGHNAVIEMATSLLSSKPLLALLTARSYPYFFVDESQDTMPTVVSALRSIAASHPDNFCLAFFGDPMQQIYTTGIGDIALGDGWERFDKPDNFRSSQSVLRTVNKIRADSDGLTQKGGRAIEGSAHLFVLPADTDREINLARVRDWLSTRNGDPLWASDERESDVRILLIARRMAAVRLGFANLHDAFNEKAWDGDKEGFRQGNHWLLQPALRLALPLVHARRSGKEADIMSLLRASSPQLDHQHLAGVKNVSELMAQLASAVSKLVALFDAGSPATIRNLYESLSEGGLQVLDGRITEALQTSPGSINVPDPDERSRKLHVTFDRFLACSVHELLGYGDYLENLSPYATQHGVKGAEFERVVVVLDDEQGRHNQFSYDKLLGVVPLSDIDEEHRAAGEDSVIERTLRLFYVCCTRARRDLAVVLYSSKPLEAAAAARRSDYFDEASVIAVDQL